MFRHLLNVAVFISWVAVVHGNGQTASTSNSYDVLLHSRSLTALREALKAILADPQTYVPRIRQGLRDYPHLLRTNPTAAKRVVYLSALVRDPSFPPILVKSLGDELVQDDCLYACPAVFALAIQSHFGGWKIPASLDPSLDAVHDLNAAIAYIPHISLKVGRIEDDVQGPWLEQHRKEIEGKTEEELIRLAGPMTQSRDTRTIAAFQLEVSVSTSKNLPELYLLAMSDFEDGSGEYKSAIYGSIYRAELAKSRGK